MDEQVLRVLTSMIGLRMTIVMRRSVDLWDVAIPRVKEVVVLGVMEAETGAVGSPFKEIAQDPVPASA
jgi:hypothetical protein